MRALGGGASCLGVGRPGSGALPAPAARPLGGLPGPTTHWLWVRGGAGVGTRHKPHSARSCILWGRHEGARGGRLLPGRGASGVGRSPTPDCPPSGRAAGAHYPLAVGAGGCGRGDPSLTPQRALLRAGFAGCRGGTRAPGGGASCLGVGRPGSGALPPPTARPLGGLPGPTTNLLWVRGGAGVGTRHQPHSARPCRLALRAVGAARGRPGGAPPAWVWGVRGRAPSNPRLPALWAGCRGPLPTGCGCGGVRAWGPVTNPTARALAFCGGGMRALGGGASCLGVGRQGSGALPPPAARPVGGLPGPTTHWLWVRGGAGVGTRHQPHSARSCILWGRHEGSRGGRLLPGRGAYGVGRSPTPDCPPSGRAAGTSYPLAVGAGGVRAWGPVTNPTARALACCGGGMRALGGGASCLGVGRPGSGALRPPAARLLGGLRGPTTHWLWVRGGAGVGTCHQPHDARPCRLALRAVGAARGRPGGAPPAWVWGVRGRALSNHRLPALWAGCRGPLPTGCGCGGVRAWGPVTNPTERAFACCGGGMRALGGGASRLGVGRPGSGALPPPAARPLGGLPGPTTDWLWVRGGAGVGTCHQPHSARSCILWGRHEGARGGRLLPGRGASGVGRSPTPDCPPSGRAAGADYLLAVGAGGVRAWGPVTNPTARALASWLCAPWGRHEGARGGRLLPGCGASGVRRSPTPDCPPCGRAAGAHYPLAVGAGGCGLGDPSPTPQRALLRAGFARCWGGTRAPGGGASCLGVGRPGWGALRPPTARPQGGLPGPTTHWLWVRGVAGLGTRHQPHSAHSCELALRAVGAARGRPGRAPPAWVWGVRGRALSHPRLPAPWAGCRGPLPIGCGCGGLRARGPVTNPTARVLACCGGGMRAPGGGASCLGVGRRGSGALPPQTARPLGGLPGPTTHWLWVRRGAGVGTRDQPQSARSCELALRAVGAARGRPGGAPPAWVWGVRGRALSHPRLPALWAVCRGPLPTGCGCGGVRAWGPLTNPTARALASWLCALWGRHEGARGGRLLPGCVASGVGRSPTPDCPPSGRAAGGHYPLAVGAGECGRGDPSPTPERALLRAGFVRCGGGTRAPPAWVWGVRGRALSHPRLPALWAGCRGPLPTGCGCRGVRAWGPVTNPTARALACCGGGMRAPGGGASCLGVGRPGSGALPAPTARPLGGLPGPTTHWLWVRGGAGVGTLHQPHSARSCELALHALGAA